jgi:hypothetical protein
MTNEFTPFELSAGEKSHPIWARLKSHLHQQLDATRIRNDLPTLSEAETAALRGRIAAYKAIIALGDDLPVIRE